MQYDTDPRRSCDHKKPHATRQSARAAKRALKRADRANYDIYFCKWCGRYHVGHRSYPKDRS